MEHIKPIVERVMRSTQLNQVRQHLEQYGSIDTWKAIGLYRITRLGQYILLLRKEGLNIASEWESGEGKRWIKYILQK